MAKLYKLKHPDNTITEHIGYNEFKCYLENLKIGKTQIFESLDKNRPTRAGYQLLEIVNIEKEDYEVTCDLCGKKIKESEVAGKHEGSPQCKECWGKWHGAEDVKNDEKLVEGKRNKIEGKINNNPKSILVIPDIHAPFTLDGYLEFTQQIYKKYECDYVIILGDILDNHYSSYHETDPDGFSANEELDKAKNIIKGFYNLYPNAKITIGNHDRIILRKTFSSGLSKHWIKDIKDVLETPNWDFKEYHIINDILFYHGEGQAPNTKATQEMISCVAGHRHSKSGINFYQSRIGKRIFAMQLGTGINQEAYAFAYNKFGLPSHVNVGIIKNGVPIIEYMEIKK